MSNYNLDKFFDNFKLYASDKLNTNSNTIIKVLSPIFNICEDEYEYGTNYRTINFENKALTLDEIYDLVRKSDDGKEHIIWTPFGNLLNYNYKMSKRDCFEALVYLEITRGIIKKVNNLTGIKYQLLDSEYEYKYKKYNIEVDYKPNKILLISDTHIGSSNENFKMLNALYDYGSKIGIDYCLHLGDLFEGSKNMNDEVLKTQILKFKEGYPVTDDFDTFCIPGNHDIKINDYIFSNQSNINTSDKYGEFDLRALSWFNPRFSMDYRFDHSCLNIGKYRIHLCHRLFVSAFCRDGFKHSNGKVKTVADFPKIQDSIDFEYDLLLSGHMHVANITNLENSKYKYPHLYLGVPSTSSLNLSTTSEYKCTSYILNFIYNNLNEVMGIKADFLAVDSNYNVIKYDELTYINNENQDEIITIVGNEKVYKKI